MCSTIQYSHPYKSACYRKAVEGIVEPLICAGGRCSDEGVIGNVQPFPEVCELRGSSVAMGLRIDAGLGGGL